METTRRESTSCRNQANRTGEFFNGLSREALQDLNSMQFPSAYAANAVLFWENDPAESIFLILEGEVRLSISSSEDRRLSLRIARKGEILGLGSAFSGTPYDMTAETLSCSKLARIGHRNFLNFLARHPEAFQTVIEELSQHVTKAFEHLRTRGLSATAPKKLARLLLDWSDSGQATECGSGARFRFSMTNEEIGEFIGASCETVNRTLRKFERCQLVAFQGSMLTIPNRIALASYANA
jgi:CRP/FNR family transcriptional regulator